MALTCQNCARHVTEAIQSTPGVRSASVSLEKKSASVHWNSRRAKKHCRRHQRGPKAGYGAKETQLEPRTFHVQHADLADQPLARASPSPAALMIGEWFSPGDDTVVPMLAFVLAGVVQIFCGVQFYRGAWRQLKIGSSNMDTLVALGSTTAWF